MTSVLARPAALLAALLCAACSEGASDPHLPVDAAIPAHADSGLADSGPPDAPSDAGRAPDASPDAATADASSACDRVPFPFQGDEEVSHVEPRTLDWYCGSDCPTLPSAEAMSCEPDTDAGAPADLDAGLDYDEWGVTRREGCGRVVIHEWALSWESYASYDATTGRLLGYTYQDDRSLGPSGCDVNGYIAGEVRDDCEDTVVVSCYERH